MTTPDGVVVVDKPAGWTSHDVVARMRRLASTRRVGHAGTLDPMATGVLVVGIGRATRLLGYLAGHDKAYDATIRLGVATDTDDATGQIVQHRDVSEVTDTAVRAAVQQFLGDIDQVPSSVSAIKVAGRPAYSRIRAGERVELAARRIRVSAFELRGLRREADVLDVDVSVVCSAGTYVRALARDLGLALGVGGHLAALRRTRSGYFTTDQARTLDELAIELGVVPLADVAGAVFPRRDLDRDEARIVSHGGRLPAVGSGPGPVGAFGPDGQLLALVEESDGLTRPLAVFVGPST